MPEKIRVREHYRSKPKSKKPGDIVICGHCGGSGKTYGGLSICSVCKGKGKVRL
jgi:DnaJ-class molecular chaperone